MVAIFKNGRRYTHVLISQFLIHVEEQSWFLNIHILGQGLQKDNYKYANLIFDHRDYHFLPKWPLEYKCFNISVSN